MVSAGGLVDAAATAVGPLCLAAALTATLLAWPAPAHADEASPTLLNDIGIGNNGAISAAIAEVGTSICPLLVQPGSSIAENAMSSKGQLASTIAGGVAGFAIQTQCPSFMTSLANGDFSVLSNAGTMLGLAAPESTSLSIPGVGRSLPGVGNFPSLGTSIPGVGTSTPLTNPLAVPGF